MSLNLRTMALALLSASALGACLIRSGAGAMPPAEPFRSEALGDAGPAGTPISGAVDRAGNAPSGTAAYRVADKQYGFKLAKPLFVGRDSVLNWSWRKPEGTVCVVQLQVVNPETGASRYLGFGAGGLGEPAAVDPTVEVWVAPAPPRQWTRVTRRLAEDIRTALGWNSAEVREVYLSPWDGSPGEFADMTFEAVTAQDVTASERARRMEQMSRIGTGGYAPPRLRRLGEARDERFDTSFEEAAPGRNSAANEWSAFGWPTGRSDLNCLGRGMRVRYPTFDLVFRLREKGVELEPGDLEGFRLGLVGGYLPAIKSSWEHGGLRYKVAAMSRPFGSGAYDIYRVEVTNPTSKPLPSALIAGLDGPPDMRPADGVVRGLGSVPFLLTPAGASFEPAVSRDWGLCDKRAKTYECGAGPGDTEAAVSSTRIGMGGLPVVYRFAAKAGVRHDVWTAASPHIAAFLGKVTKAGDLILRYEVEGAGSQTVDWFTYISQKPRVICVGFRGAGDLDGDGMVEVRAACDARSRLRHTRLSAIYVFPAGTPVADPAELVAGRLNALCVQHIDVGATPETGWQNQNYGMTDVGIARLNLPLGGLVPAGGSRVFWLKAPPFQRRDPASMGTYSHAFREALPREAAPPFSQAQLADLARRDPVAEWNASLRWWAAFAGTSAQISTPDAVLGDVYRSRLAARAILDVRIAGNVWFNPCSAWFYYDFAFRDQAYVVYAYDLAGLHDRSRRLLRAYCMDLKDAPQGPTGFADIPIRIGMRPDGLWNTRPGQFDTQGQNIWCVVQHYKLTGDRPWLRAVAYPFVRRGAQWLVNSRHKHMAEVRDPNDPRYGLIEPGAMEVGSVTKGMHMYYMDAWAVLGLNEAADAASAAGIPADAARFRREAADLRACLLRSCRRTFRRSGLYEGSLWFGVEQQGDGMYGMWGHTPLLWPTRVFEPHDPLWTATDRRMLRGSHEWGGGIFSEGSGSSWPYIGVDWAIGAILRGEPERAADYFCAFTDTAGHTFSWGEGYDNKQNTAAGDQPHMWADAQWLNLYRHLFAMEEGDTLLLTPATLRRWQGSGKAVSVAGLPTHFGALDLNVRPSDGGRRIIATFRIVPRGDQAARPLGKVVLSARLPNGRALASVRLDGKPLESWSGETVVVPRPARGRVYRLEMKAR
jgi:hypothetical protein